MATLLVFLDLNLIVWPYLYEAAAVAAMSAVAVAAREAAGVS